MSAVSNPLISPPGLQVSCILSLTSLSGESDIKLRPAPSLVTQLPYHSNMEMIENQTVDLSQCNDQ
jgi:hypothetical protein